MLRVGFESTTPVFERAKTVHALDRADFLSLTRLITISLVVKFLIHHSLARVILLYQTMQFVSCRKVVDACLLKARFYGVGGWLDIDFSTTCHGYFSIHRISYSLLTINLLGFEWSAGDEFVSSYTKFHVIINLYSIFIIIVFVFIYGFYINYLKLMFLVQPYRLRI
jgi:hypothetical protein